MPDNEARSVRIVFLCSVRARVCCRCNSSCEGTKEIHYQGNSIYIYIYNKRQSITLNSSSTPRNPRKKDTANHICDVVAPLPCLITTLPHTQGRIRIDTVASLYCSDPYHHQLLLFYRAPSALWPRYSHCSPHRTSAVFLPLCCYCWLFLRVCVLGGEGRGGDGLFVCVFVFSPSVSKPLSFFILDRVVAATDTADTAHS